MPPDAYLTITLKKSVIRKLTELQPNTSLSKAVTDAIYEYVVARKDCKPIFKTPDLPYLSLTCSNQLTKGVVSEA